MLQLVQPSNLYTEAVQDAMQVSAFASFLKNPGTAVLSHNPCEVPLSVTIFKCAISSSIKLLLHLCLVSLSPTWHALLPADTEVNQQIFLYPLTSTR
jgi:hypothetical protein